jgi:hypothetical protein
MTSAQYDAAVDDAARQWCRIRLGILALAETIMPPHVAVNGWTANDQKLFDEEYQR